MYHQFPNAGMFFNARGRGSRPLLQNLAQLQTMPRSECRAAGIVFI